MAKYKITKCVSSRQLVGTEFEGVIIKPVVEVIHKPKKTRLTLFQKMVITRFDKIEITLSNLDRRVLDLDKRVCNLVSKNDLAE
jgi:hypothetical protein